MVDKATSKVLRRKFIFCRISFNWFDEELRQLVKDRRTCFAQGIDNDSSWNDYLKTRKEL